jgi:hypothetical protein
MGIKRVAGLVWNKLLMRVDNNTGKGTSGMDKFSSEVHKVHMDLGGKLLNSLNQDPVPWKASECECCRSLSKSLALSTRFWASETRLWTRNANASILRHSKRSCKAFVLAAMACFGREEMASI